MFLKKILQKLLRMIFLAGPLTLTAMQNEPSQAHWVEHSGEKDFGQKLYDLGNKEFKDAARTPLGSTSRATLAAKYISLFDERADQLRQIEKNLTISTEHLARYDYWMFSTDSYCCKINTTNCTEAEENALTLLRHQLVGFFIKKQEERAGKKAFAFKKELNPLFDELQLLATLWGFFDESPNTFAAYHAYNPETDKYIEFEYRWVSERECDEVEIALKKD